MADLLRWPDEEDLNGAATALMRLQDTYNLDTAQLARGQILGKKQAYRELTGKLLYIGSCILFIILHSYQSYWFEIQEAQQFYIYVSFNESLRMEH